MAKDDNFNAELNDHNNFKELFTEIQKREVCDTVHKENLRERLAAFMIEEKDKSFILKSRKRYLLKIPVFRLAFSFSIIIILVFSSVFIYLSFPQTKPVICSAEALNGDVLIKEQNLENIRAGEGNPLKSGDTVMTLKNSQATLNIGEKTNIRLGVSTEVKLLSLKKEKIQCENIIYLSKGSIDCNIYLPDKKSVFKIITDLATYSVKSTSFCLTKNEQGDLDLHVKEGIVEIVFSLQKDMDRQDLTQIDEDIYRVMAYFCDKRFFCTDERSLLLRRTEVDSLFSEAGLIEKEIYKTFKDTGGLSNDKKREFIRRIQLLEEKQNILVIKKEQDNYVCEKVGLPETVEKDNTAIYKECNKDKIEVYNEAYKKDKNEKDIFPAINTNVRIETQQGNIIKGKITEKDADSGIKVNTALGEIYLPQRIIKSVSTY